jgi:hypothetical protein
MDRLPLRILAPVFLLGALLGAGLGYFGKSAASSLALDLPAESSQAPESAPSAHSAEAAKTAQPPADFYIKPFSTPSDNIVSMAYSAKNFLLTAQRSKPAERFIVQISYADDRPPQQCRAPDALAAALDKLALIDTSAALEAEALKRRFPEVLGRLEIRDTLFPGPPAPIQFYAAANKKSIALAVDDLIAEADLPFELFARLESGCQP